MSQRVLALCTVSTLAPATSWACSVCFTGEEATQAAFIGTTVFLSLLPLMLIGGGVWWLWRRARRIEDELDDRRFLPSP